MSAITTVSGRMLPLAGPNIDTDRIIPARFLRTVSFEGLEAHVFEDDRAAAKTAGDEHPFDAARFAGAAVLVVNANFGCGSSREHAPQAIRRRGIRAIVGVSYSEIFFGNSVALGMPCVSAPARVVEMLMRAVEQDPALRLELDLSRMTVTGAGRVVQVTLPAAARDAFLSGSWDATGLLLERYEDVERVAANLPYVTGWR